MAVNQASHDIHNIIVVISYPLEEMRIVEATCETALRAVEMIRCLDMPQMRIMKATSRTAARG